MSIRRIVEHVARNREGELLQVINVYPAGVNKEQVKKENRYSKRHKVLVSNGHKYDYKSKRA